MLRLAAAVLLVEAALQTVAVAVWWLQRPPTAATALSGPADVLCVGDSYTQGDGATSDAGSYPTQLRERLQARCGRPVTLINAGWRGQDSRDVLASLGSHLQRTRPRIVCVLVGCNDQWNRPAPFRAGDEEASGRFRWRWRTLRVTKFLLQGIGLLHGDASDHAATPAMIAAAGRLLHDAGLKPAQVTAQMPTPVVGATAEAITTARGHWNRRAFAAALSGLQTSLAAEPAEPEVLRLATECSVRLGDRAAVADHLARLRRQQAASGDLTSTEHLGFALWAAGEADAAQAMAAAGVERFAAAPGLWHLLAEAALRRDEAEAAVALRAELRALPAFGPASTSTIAQLGRCLRRTEPTVAARLLLAAMLLNGQRRDYPWTCFLTAAGDGLRAEDVHAIAAAVDVDDAGRALLQVRYDEAFGGGNSGWLAVLEQHLLTAGAMIRAAGAEPVFLCYPRSIAAEACQLRCATALAAPFAPVRERFDAALAATPSASLLAVDGHCNDAGYQLMATAVAEVVAPLLCR